MRKLLQTLSSVSAQAQRFDAKIGGKGTAHLCTFYLSETGNIHPGKIFFAFLVLKALTGHKMLW